LSRDWDKVNLQYILFLLVTVIQLLAFKSRTFSDIEAVVNDSFAVLFGNIIAIAIKRTKKTLHNRKIEVALKDIVRKYEEFRLNWNALNAPINLCVEQNQKLRNIMFCKSQRYKT
jgi:hypothetical protein